MLHRRRRPFPAMGHVPTRCTHTLIDKIISQSKPLYAILLPPTPSPPPGFTFVFHTTDEVSAKTFMQKSMQSAVFSENVITPPGSMSIQTHRHNMSYLHIRERAVLCTIPMLLPHTRQMCAFIRYLHILFLRIYYRLSFYIPISRSVADNITGYCPSG